MKKSELRQIIREEISLLTEVKSKHIYVERYGSSELLWESYSAGSGTTIPLKNWKTFYTDKPGDSHFDSSVTRISE
jgi:hypothetical protein